MAQPSWFIELTIPGLKSWGKWRKGKGNFTGNCEHFFFTPLTFTSPAMQYTWVPSLGEEDPLEKEMATHFSILAWKIPWTEEPDRQSMASQRVGHNWAHMRTGIYMKPLYTMIFLLLLLDFGECVLTFYLGQIQIEVSFNTNLTGLSPWYTCMFPSLSSHYYHAILLIESIISVYLVKLT